MEACLRTLKIGQCRHRPGRTCSQESSAEALSHSHPGRTQQTGTAAQSAETKARVCTWNGERQDFVEPFHEDGRRDIVPAAREDAEHTLELDYLLAREDDVVNRVHAGLAHLPHSAEPSCVSAIPESD